MQSRQTTKNQSGRNVILTHFCKLLFISHGLCWFTTLIRTMDYIKGLQGATYHTCDVRQVHRMKTPIKSEIRKPQTDTDQSLQSLAVVISLG